MDSFGTIFRVELFGESHGPFVGVVIDGLPAGMALSEADFAPDILRRAPGKEGTTARRERDIPQIRSGLYNGCTTAAPLCIEFPNEDISESGTSYIDFPRPGHCDYTASRKWNGYNDPRGGGHFSGRLTLPLVAAGVVAKKIISPAVVEASLVEMGGEGDRSRWDSLLEAAASGGDSLGGIVECSVSGIPVGLGEPFFDSVESVISHAAFSIPGIRGIEFGDGFAASRMRGSEHNDPFGPEGPVKNGSGGVNGGISNGAPLVFRLAVKPTSSISAPQRSWNFASGKEETMSIRGRNDVCFALRLPVIVEAIAAISLADLMLRWKR